MSEPEDVRFAQARLTRAQVCRMLGISEQQLSAWERQGWIETARENDGRHGREPRQARYSFSDILILKTLARLRRSGVPAERLRLVQAALRDRLGKDGFRQPWSELQIFNEGKRLAVYFQGTRMEPLTGQLWLDYEGAPGSEKVRRMMPGVRPRETVQERMQRAERLFLAALRYEERPETLPKAIRAYQRVLELNPQAMGALVNLGTIYYNHGLLKEAEQCYRAALTLNPASAMVRFNLGNVHEERGELARAREEYEEAVRLDPNYSDPRYNLALVYERLGLHGRAMQQWRAYLKLDAHSPWAAFARQKIEQAGFRVLHTPKPAQVKKLS